MTTIPLTAVRRAGNVVHEVTNVDPLLVRVAALTAELVSRRLGIPTPRVRWLPPDRTDVRGETLPANLGEVWVKVQDRAAVVETTAHECRHAWQLEATEFRWTQPGLKTMEEREADAREYGQRIRAELMRA